MTFNYANRHVAALLFLATVLLAPGSIALPSDSGDLPAGAQDSEEQFRFSVWYNDKRIGQHQFDVRRTENAMQVRSSAAFEIKILFVPVYHYRHEAEELWRDGCLASLQSNTNDNGERYQLTLRAGARSLHLEQTEPEALTSEIAAECAATYAYWDLARLQRSELINSQTGELTPVALNAAGEETIDGVPTNRYTLNVEGTGSIDLWYRQADDRWLMLRTDRNGGTLTYRAEA